MMIINVFLLSVLMWVTSHDSSSTPCSERRGAAVQCVNNNPCKTFYNFIRERGVEGKLEQHPNLCLDDRIVLLHSGNIALLKQMHNVCKSDWEGWCWTQDTDLLWQGGDTCKYNFCLPQSPEDRLTVSLAFETLIQCYLPLRCILKQIWSIWITKTRVTPGRVLSTVHSVPEMNSKQKEILKKDFTGYNGRNISKIMLH